MYERHHNYHWSIKAYLAEHYKDGKKGCKQTNFHTNNDILLKNGLLISLFTSFLPIGQLKSQNGPIPIGGVFGLNGLLCFYTSIDIL